MPPQPLIMNPNYFAMVRGSRDLHLLMSQGLDDSPEADAIRDATDAPWESLSEIERRRVRNLSEDLYSLHELAPAVQPTNPQAQSRLAGALEARKQGDWDRALDLLRRWGAYLDPALVAYLRGSIWLEAGDPATATLFFEHASKLQPDDENYRMKYLDALSHSDPDAARKVADDILREQDKSPPGLIAFAINVEFRSLQAASDTEVTKRLQRLTPILERILAKFQREDAPDSNRSFYVLTLSLLGFAYEILGDPKRATENYSLGLRIDPTNDALFIARGILQYGTSKQAIQDFEKAIQYGSPVIWPYFCLAHHRLTVARFDDCRRLCEVALTMPGSPAVKSELSEWLAIAQAELGFSAEMVRGSFEDAIRLNPSGERAARNLAAFEAAVRPSTQTWETRTSAAVRTSGLAERKCTMAA